MGEEKVKKQKKKSKRKEDVELTEAGDDNAEDIQVVSTSNDHELQEVSHKQTESEERVEKGNLSAKVRSKFTKLNPLKSNKKDLPPLGKDIKELTNFESNTGDKTEKDVDESEKVKKKKPKKKAKLEKTITGSKQEESETDCSKPDGETDIESRGKKESIDTSSLVTEKTEESEQEANVSYHGQKSNQTIDDIETLESEDKLEPLEDKSKRKLSTKEKLQQKLSKKKHSDLGSKKLLRQQSSRVEDRLRDEDIEAQSAFDKHVVNRKGKIKKDESLDNNLTPTPEQAYDFFTATWNESAPQSIIEPIESVKLKKKRNQKKKKAKKLKENEEGTTEEENEGYETATEEPEEEEGTSDTKKLLSKDYIGKQYEWQLTSFEGPEIQIYKFRIENEKKSYFVPPSTPAANEDKIGDMIVKITEEEEGLHTGDKPKYNSSHINKLEHRIIKEQQQKEKKVQWFDANCELVSLPNPLIPKPSRHQSIDTEETDDFTYFMPAVPSHLEQQLITSSALLGGAHCQLELDVISVVFGHHHLFSLEHHLSRKLMDLYQDYSNRLRNNTIESLSARLKILYNECNKVQSRMVTAKEEELKFQEKRLSAYQIEIKSLRKERDEVSKNERDLIKSLLATWKDLRDVRRKQNYTITTHKITIHKESVNIDSDRREWNFEIEKELEERKQEFEMKKDDRNEVYEESLEKWKILHAKRKEVRQRHKKHQKDMEKGKGSVDANEFAEDEEFLSQPEPEKPLPPDDFNENKVLQEIENNAKLCRRNPGEPKLILELTMTGIQQLKLMKLINNCNTTKENEIADNRELNRRNAVSKSKLFIKIFFNGKEVCQSSSRIIGQDFVIPIGHIFPIQIVQWPESLMIQIIEGSTLKTITLAEVNIPICDSKTSLDKADIEGFKFENDLQITHGHAGLGSGTDFSVSADNSRITQESIRGKVLARVGWGKAADGSLLAPPADQWKAAAREQGGTEHVSEVFDSDGKVDPDKLETWLLKSRLDPNDPRNAELMSNVTSVSSRKPGMSMSAVDTQEVGTDGGHFRLDQMHDQFTFCSEAELDSNVRFQVIQLRRAKAPEFRNYRMVPAYEKEIPRGILEAYQKKLETSRREVAGSSDPLRGKSCLFLEQTRAQVSHRFSIAKHRKRHGDVVNEDGIPDLNTLFMMFGEMVPAQRPLRPVRQERKRVTMQDLSDQEVKILLTVVRAYDVPVRHDPDPVAAAAAAVAAQQPKEADVHSYVEATFQGSVRRTATAPGPSPAWNQELELSFRPANNDFSPDSMRRVKDCLHLHLFDEVTVDLLEDEEEVERAGRIHQRMEKRWLGSLSVPFSSLYQNTRVEGTFRLHSPSVLLGYERLGLAAQHADGGGGGESAAVDKDATYLNIYLTIQPALNAPEPVREKLDCEEAESIVAACERWARTLAGYYRHRQLNPLVVDLNGQAVLMTRYLRGIPPPPEVLRHDDNNDNDVSSVASSVAWFVSLLPYVPSNALFPGLCDIWPTSDEFLQMLAGSETEHALLLANYFAGLGRTAYLVVGQGVPEGRTAYVLSVEENGDHLLWNPVTSEHFAVTETFCPLQSVWAVVGPANVWGNLQPSDQPQRIRWDLANTSDWLPLFTKGSAPPALPSVQPDQIALAPADHRAAKQLKEKIEKVLRDTLMNLRKKMNLRTSLNFQGKAVLAKLLPGLEAARLGTAVSRNVCQEHLSELQRILSSHKVCGFPLHFAYSDLDVIVSALKSTGLHLTRETNVEFSLAVHVEAYPATVMSVWVYVASLQRRR